MWLMAVGYSCHAAIWLGNIKIYLNDVAHDSLKLSTKTTSVLGWGPWSVKVSSHICMIRFVDVSKLQDTIIIPAGNTKKH